MRLYYRDYWYVASLVALSLIFALANVVVIQGGTPAGADSAAVATPTRPAVATQRAAPTPAPTADPVTADFARTLDLAAARDALGAYYRANGAFPATNGGVTTLCDDAADAGCVLSSMDVELSFDDGDDPYWYASDGRTFTLIARAALSQPGEQPCPENLPAQLASGPVICMTGRGD